MALSVTVGTDSYVTSVEADTYLGMSIYGADWVNADPDERVRALVTSARIMERIPYVGRKALWSQSMAFPRIVEEQIHDDYLDPINVPQSVKDAQCEEALARLRHGDDVRLGLLELGMSSMTIDQANESYKDTAGVGFLSQAAKELMRRWTAFAINVANVNRDIE